MRRYKVQVEADFPPEIAARLRGHGAPGQPVGHRRQDKRDEWAEDLKLSRVERRRRTVRVPVLRRLRGQLRRPAEEGQPRAW